MFLELFGLFFLLVKLTLVPLFEFIQRRFFPHKDRSLETNEKHVQLTRFSRSSDNEASKKKKNMTKQIENGIEIPFNTVL